MNSSYDKSIVQQFHCTCQVSRQEGALAQHFSQYLSGINTHLIKQPKYSKHPEHRKNPSIKEKGAMILEWDKAYLHLMAV
jgi:hypothetical protein